MNNSFSFRLRFRDLRAGAVLLLAVAAGVIVGCSARAVRPPTPAAHVHAAELDDVPPPGERYYLLIFASQSTPIRAKYTHSWATTLRVVEGAPGTTPQIEEHTISWMPATLDIHPLRFRVEPGKNLDLKESLDNAVKNHERISLWGPYEIKLGLFRKSLMQREFMMSGRVGYQCIDSVGEARSGKGCDCIHAVTDMDAEYDRRTYPLSKFGDKASEHITAQVATRGGIVNPPQTHDWLLPALGLDQYKIVRRAIPDERSRLVGRRPAAPAADAR